MSIFIPAAVALYFAALSLFLHYSRQNSQPVRRAVDELVKSPVVNAGWLRLAHDIAAPAAGEVRDVEAH